MDIGRFIRRDEYAWEIPATGGMRVPAVIYASRELVEAMDEKVGEQACNVARLPGIVTASYAMPDAHWGYGFPIGAGRAMSRRAALRKWSGRQIVDELARRGIQVRSPSKRGVAEEAPGAYKDVDAVVESAERAQLARRVARLLPMGVVKG